VQRITTPDGRTIQVHEGGDPDGLPVLVSHGTPGHGSLCQPHVDDALARGVRLLGYDRPGYGGSSPQPGRSVADGAHDDQFVPIAHGRWLAERIPNVDARLSPDDGHLTLATRRMPEVQAWLVERLQA
jgi:pimeloyl-ACP methyl ester carboxylesterase